MKTISFMLALLGLAVVTALVAWLGAGAVWDAARAVGWGGFLLLCAAQVPLFLVLAWSWWVIAPTGGFLAYLWGRMVRDSAGNCLPFTHMGGFVAGVRAMALRGVAGSGATASTIADVTAEVLAQVVFAAIGLIILVAHVPDTRWAWPVAGVLAVALPALAGFMLAQRGAGRIFARLSRHIAAEWFTDARQRADVLAAEFALIYGHTLRLAGCVGIHLLGWLGTGVLGWAGLHLLGAEISLLDAIALEGLLHAVLAVAFFIPGHAGVQEAAYIGLGAAFGVGAEVALAASLLRRARDLAWGVPVLAVWQWMEWRGAEWRRGG